MSSSTTRPGMDNIDWEQATEKAKVAAALISEMASLAASAAGARVSRVMSDSSVIASQTVRDLGGKADQLASNAGVGLQGLGDMISKNSPQVGVLKDASDALAGFVNEGGEYLQEAKLSGVTEDVSHVIRRNPIPSVLIALGVGWFIGRALKG